MNEKHTVTASVPCKKWRTVCNFIDRHFYLVAVMANVLNLTVLGIHFRYDTAAQIKNWLPFHLVGFVIIAWSSIQLYRFSHSK
jgi:hypothetical protein